MKYIKKFNDHSNYDYVIDNYTKINENKDIVSYCKEQNHIHINKYVDPYNGYEYVDLGLPSGTLWAKCNVGASSETDYGNYYKYGEGIIQYDGSANYYRGGENPLSPSVDTVTNVMGGQWHMPTKTQYEELINNTTFSWTTINSIKGGKFTATNGNYIFLPAGGYYEGGSSNNNSINKRGGYWSSTPYPGLSQAYYLFFSYEMSDNLGIGHYNRNQGYNVRGVAD
jgi:uncharacterized protein (TIGR02145 family)